MENRRLFLFLLSTMTFLWLWSNFLAPPQPEPDAQDGDAALIAEDNPGADLSGDQSAGQLTAAGDAAADPPGAGAAGSAVTAQPPVDPVNPAAGAPTLNFPDYEATAPLLGSLQADSGYGLQVQLSSIGASVEGVWLTSPLS